MMRDAMGAIGAVLAFYAAAALPVFAGLLVFPVSWWEGEGAIALQTALLFAGAVAASSLFVGAGWANLAMLGFRRSGSNMRWFAYGTALGLVMAGSALFLAVFMGGAQISVVSDSLLEYLLSLVSVGMLLLFAAFTEELLFRGYPITRLALSVGKLPASLGLAIVFLLAHGLNPEVSTFGLINIGLAALVLSAAFFGPGGIVAAWGVHVGWNGGLGMVADAPVSGVKFEIPFVDFLAGGPDWFTGGSFGPEGGLITTIAMTAALVWLLRNKNLREDLSK